jgi:hypothetical protein
VRIEKSSPVTHPADKACRICGKVANLSYEHVSPKAVGNDGRLEMLGFDAWTSQSPLSGHEKGARRAPSSICLLIS